jgi:hypothetical protein
LSPGEPLTFVTSAEESPDLDARPLLKGDVSMKRGVLPKPFRFWDTADPLWDRIRQLILA